MSLVELIAQADERGLAASGLACLDRCVPLLGGDDEALRPLWANLAAGGDPAAWGELLDQVRGKLGVAEVVDDEDVEDEAALLARRMLAAAPAVRSAPEARIWADACSVASLQIHRLLDPAEDDASSADALPQALNSVRAGGAPTIEGRAQGMSPLVAAELRRQISVLELLAQHGAGGLRRALEVSTEGRRVLRAVVSRRARGRA
ncbi:hypothetical protein [Streptomyces cyaneus]|uniref:hypothetical protein n=1 Tax=Streptomyces cyaneus TaxID=1904 RepID=UPI000FF87DCF|nr:hypothetical protein [Streptomyces cyaneus]